MTAGKLASAKPGATTDTFLYRCPIDKAASAVLNIANQSGSGASYRVGLRDYDQILTLDSSSYSYRKGNVISSYIFEITPGVQISSLNPGDLVTTSNTNGTFRYLDFVKPTTTISIPVEVHSIGSGSVGTVSGGVFSAGDTITGTNGLTALVYYYDSTQNTLQLEIDNVTDVATSFRISGDGTAVAAADLLNIDDELVTISSATGNLLTVTRGSSATTAAAHLAGVPVTIVRPTADTTTLAADITDTAATTIDVADAATANLTVGNYIQINNEFLLIEGISVNSITVARGTLGTTAATHTTGDTVTRHTDEGYVSLQYFENGETVDNGSGVTALASVGAVSQTVYTPEDRFVYDIDSTGTFSLPSSLTLNIDRTYRFTQDDTSNTGQTLGFKLSPEGAAYTTDVTINGTAGTGGSYTQIIISDATPTSIFIASADVNGVTANIDTDPLYTEIYVYDVEGTIVATDSFDTGTGSNDILTVTSGAYGYVQGVSGADIKVSLGLNSPVFQASDSFYDVPREAASLRAVATVSSTTLYTDVEVEDYLFYGKTINANSTDKNSSIVIGPGQSIVVYSSAADLSYVLNGFEDVTSDFTVYHYTRA